jgi:hypothetical protein
MQGSWTDVRWLFQIVCKLICNNIYKNKVKQNKAINIYSGRGMRAIYFTH